MSDYERIEKVIQYLERHYLKQPALTELAKVAGLSEFHFHRMFTRWAGTTPKSFLQYLTAGHAKNLLEESRDLLDTAFESGLSGPSRLHDLFVSVEAMTPGEFKTKGAGVEIKYGFHPSPFGRLLVGLTKRGVCYLAFVDENDERALAGLKAKFRNADFKSSRTDTGKIAKRIFAKKPGRRIPVVLSGTAFQIKVWEALIRIPPGQVLSYSGIAEAVGSPGASRAVGTALANNTVAYLIPCHRVIRETGEFGEYRWGAHRKQAVIAWESGRNRKDNT